MENLNVLEGLLVKSRKIETRTEGLGISIYNESAKYHIIKVCNPYCGPCAKAHPVLEDLVNAGKIIYKYCLRRIQTVMMLESNL